MVSRTEQALALVDSGMKVREAARKVDISESAVHAAVKRKKAEAAGGCLSCGQPTDAAKAERQRIIVALEATIAKTEGADRKAYYQSVVDWLRKQ